jgi:hypothetical protein
MATHIQIRRDTAANWTAANPVLLLGEIGIETNTTVTSSTSKLYKAKIGDGTTAWNALPYFSISSPISIADVDGLENDLAKKADLVDGLVPAEQIPSIAITEYLGKVDDEAEMLTLIGEKGDWCIRQDEGIPYVIVGNDPSLFSNWMALLIPSNPVITVNGKTGPTVVIGISDIDTLATELAGKASSSHSHSISNITGLTDELNSKASTRDVLRFINISDGTPVTGTTGITLLKSVLIPAGTFQPGDVIRIRLRNRKTGGNGVFTSGIYIHTLPQVSGASQLGIYTTTGITNLTTGMKRDFYIKSATVTEGMWSNQSLASDDIFTVQNVSNTNIDWTVDQYILATVNPNSASDSIVNSSMIIEIL